MIMIGVVIKLARRKRRSRSQKVRDLLCEIWIVSIPIKYRNCSFRIVGYRNFGGAWVCTRGCATARHSQSIFSVQTKSPAVGIEPTTSGSGNRRASIAPRGLAKVGHGHAGARTQDLRLIRATLYRLSYTTPKRIRTALPIPIELIQNQASMLSSAFNTSCLGR